MPILPQTLSRKFYNATMKVKQFIDSIDGGESDLEDKPEFFQSPNISSPQEQFSISQSSNSCIQMVEKCETSHIPDIPANKISDDKISPWPDFSLSLQNQETSSVSNPSANCFIKGQDKLLPTEAVSNGNLCLNSPSQLSRSYVCTSNNCQLPSCMENSSNILSSEVLTSTSHHYFDSKDEQKNPQSLQETSGSDQLVSSVASTNISSVPIVSKSSVLSSPSIVCSPTTFMSSSSENCGHVENSKLSEQCVENNYTNFTVNHKSSLTPVSEVSSLSHISISLSPNFIPLDIASVESDTHKLQEASFSKNICDNRHSKCGLRTNSNSENVVVPNLHSETFHKNSKYKSEVKNLSGNSTRVWCIFCENSEHSSHVCRKFPTKEKFWAKILHDRRCKNCLGLFHKSDSCYKQKSCKNFGCYRRDKHSPVICYTSYLYVRQFSPIFFPCNKNMKNHLGFSHHFTNNKPPPLMSIHYLDVYKKPNELQPYKQNEKSILSSKNLINTSTQTPNVFECSNSKIPNFKDQSCQTNFENYPKLELNSFVSQVSSNDGPVNSITRNKNIKYNDSSPCKPVLNISKDNLTYENKTLHSDAISVCSNDITQTSLPHKMATESETSENHCTQKNNTQTFSEMMDSRGPFAGTIKNINGFDVRFPPQIWEDPTNPEHLRALEFLRHRVTNKCDLNIDKEIERAAIDCVKIFIQKSEPKDAAICQSQLRFILKNLPVSKA